MTTPYGAGADGMMSDYSRVELPLDFLRKARTVLKDFPV